MFFCGEDLTCLMNLINFYLLREKSGEERERKESAVEFPLV